MSGKRPYRRTPEGSAAQAAAGRRNLAAWRERTPRLPAEKQRMLFNIRQKGVDYLTAYSEAYEK